MSRPADRERVLRWGPLAVWRYPAAGEALPWPVVLVPSIINTARIFDLRRGQSLARHLAGQGLEVFLIDWGRPRAADAQLGLEDYCLRLPRRVLDAVLAGRGKDARAHLFGYCLGGVFSLVAGARLPRVASVLALTTPVDLREPGALGALVSPELLDLDRLAAAHPVVPGELLWAAFQALDPVGVVGKWRGLLARWRDLGFLRRFFAQEAWLADPVPVTARALRGVVEDLYRKNALREGQLLLEGRPFALAEGRVPVLNLIAERDGIVPPACSRPLAELWGGPVTTRSFPGGHIGVTVGSRAPENLWAVASRWLREHQPTPPRRRLRVGAERSSHVPGSVA
ncbi:MAG: hypothetical protein D6731_08035 [Planctomycetota bacterium]|nr:MAG: hypothetical protein D6731_08035 [Planctomycetota bacterium]